MARAKQTIIVSKTVAPTKEKARAIAKRYADRIYTARETSTSFRFRQRPPSDFVAGSYKTSKPRKGVAVVYGELKGKRGKK